MSMVEGALLTLYLLLVTAGFALFLRSRRGRTSTHRFIQVGVPLSGSGVAAILICSTKVAPAPFIVASSLLLASLPGKSPPLLLATLNHFAILLVALIARGAQSATLVLLLLTTVGATCVNLVHARRRALQRRRLQALLRRLRFKLRHTERQVDVSSSSERRRLRQELHDGTSQIMAAAKLELRVLRQQWRPDPELELRLERVETLVTELMQASREVIENLEPRALEERGLRGALAGLCERFEELTSGSCSFHFGVDEADVPITTANAVYRIVQESLTNCYKHSGARRAWVSVTLDHTLVVEVGDDGNWAGAPATSGRGLGLSGMTQRAADLGGQLTVGRGLSGGTVVRAELPRSAGTVIRSVSEQLSTTSQDREERRIASPLAPS